MPMSLVRANIHAISVPTAHRDVFHDRGSDMLVSANRSCQHLEERVSGRWPSWGALVS